MLYQLSYTSMAGRQGFEPWDRYRPTVFKTAAIDLSATCPLVRDRGLEPLRIVHLDLSQMCLPIPPIPHMVPMPGFEPGRLRNGVWARRVFHSTT